MRQIQLQGRNKIKLRITGLESVIPDLNQFPSQWKNKKEYY